MDIYQCGKAQLLVTPVPVVMFEKNVILTTESGSKVLVNTPHAMMWNGGTWGQLFQPQSAN